MGSGQGYRVDPDMVFRSSVGFLDTKDFVFSIASGVAGDLSACAGMAGDDGTAHSFAAKYEPAARSIVSAIGTAGQGMATISSRLLKMAANYLAAEDAAVAALTGKINTSSGLSRSTAEGCEPSNAAASLPMVTGSKQVHEIPVIGKFWPQGDPDKLRAAAKAWAMCASLVDDAQVNAARHANTVNEDCRGEAFDAFQGYAAKVYTPHPAGSRDISSCLPLMENISGACRLMHDACSQYAEAIDTCRETLIGLGVTAGVVTAGGVLLTVFTLGGSDVAAGAADAALVGEAAAAAELLATTEAGSAAAAAVAEAEAVVASLAARLGVGAGVAGATTLATVGGSTVANAAPAMPPGTPGPLVGPVGPQMPPAFPLYSPAQSAAAQVWVAALPSRLPNYGTADDRAYQLRVAGTPERQMSGANGQQVWADGFRPADGAIIDAKNVRKQGCSPRTLQGLQEGSFNTNMLLKGDESELTRYQSAIDNPANHAQYLEIDTNDQSTTGYWQYLCASHHVTNNVRYVP